MNPKKSKKDRERPGILLYFDSMITLQKLSDEAKGKFLTACLEYGKSLKEPNFHCPVMSEQVRLETLWEQTKPRIDSDAEGWRDGIIQRKYAGYCSGCERRGEIPMTYDEYREWSLTLKERQIEEGLFFEESEQPLTVVDGR